VPIHSSFLLTPDRPLSAPERPVSNISYTRTPATIQSGLSPEVGIPAPVTTYACFARQLAPPVTQFVTLEPRSRMPRVLIDMARRRGMEAVAHYYDAGLSAQVLA
jgi:hypothetical protein